MKNTLILNPPFFLNYRPILNLKLFLTLFLILLFFLPLFYIFQINDFTAKNYLYQNYKRKLNSLSEENNELKIGFEKRNSMEKIENLVSGLNFEKTNKIHYFQVLEGGLVKEIIRIR